MKDSLIKSLMALLQKSKGKKPVVIVITIAVFVLGYFAVQKGYISQDLLDSGILTDQVDSVFSTSTVDSISTIDSIAPAIGDTVK